MPRVWKTQALLCLPVTTGWRTRESRSIFFPPITILRFTLNRKKGGCKRNPQKNIVWLPFPCCEDSLDKGGYREWKVFEHWELETPHRRFRQNRGWPTLWPCNSHLVANQQKELKSNCKRKLLCSITHVSICKDCSFLVTGKMKNKIRHILKSFWRTITNKYNFYSSQNLWHGSIFSIYKFPSQSNPKWFL